MLKKLPSVEGTGAGQLYTISDGSWWFPGRQDLDTMLSKIDPTRIAQVEVLPGPYSLRYGPGLAFLNVVTALTPRYPCGPQTHGMTGLTYRANGNQW